MKPPTTGLVNWVLLVCIIAITLSIIAEAIVRISQS